MSSFAHVEEYSVARIPPSLQTLCIDFVSSDEDQACFLTAFIDRNLAFVENASFMKPLLGSVLVMSQRFIADLNVYRLRASIRDVSRFFEYFRYLTSNPFLLSAQPEYAIPVAAFVSLGLAYFYRIPSIDRKWRTRYADLVDAQSREFLPRQKIPGHFLDVLSFERDAIFKRIDKSNGIAATNTIRENVFACVISMAAAVPLLLVGPPGCSKTLAFSVAAANFMGPSSHDPLFRKLPRLCQVRYQCAEGTSASEIEQAFNSAVAMQGRLEASGLVAERVVLLLDEAGLPTETARALKALHKVRLLNVDSRSSFLMTATSRLS